MQERTIERTKEEIKQPQRTHAYTHTRMLCSFSTSYASSVSLLLLFFVSGLSLVCISTFLPLALRLTFPSSLFLPLFYHNPLPSQSHSVLLTPSPPPSPPPSSPPPPPLPRPLPPPTAATPTAPAETLPRYCPPPRPPSPCSGPSQNWT